ncbi:hypothetical protein [Nocardia sp. NPDC050710]|uniref:hypothetical protein n=1 Tax=Nocardia sp. NPDC050710 TaxID=3157220 RepID=UPI0034082475
MSQRERAAAGPAPQHPRVLPMSGSATDSAAPGGNEPGFHELGALVRTAVLRGRLASRPTGASDALNAGGARS